MQKHTYILKWRHGVSPEIQWFIRGIREDGSFYGELLSVWESSQVIDGRPVKGIGKTIEGTLSPEDSSRFNELVTGIGISGAGSGVGWTGLLAEGPITAPAVHIYYAPGDEETSNEAASFLLVIQLLEEYVRPSYADLTLPALRGRRMELIDVRMADGSRHFAVLPETIPWESLHDHVAALTDAKITGYLTDQVTEAWIDLTYQGYSMTINNQYGEFWFFVDDPNCPSSILADVISHCVKVLAR